MKKRRLILISLFFLIIAGSAAVYFKFTGRAPDIAGSGNKRLLPRFEFKFDSRSTSWALAVKGDILYSAGFFNIKVFKINPNGSLTFLKATLPTKERPGLKRLDIADLFIKGDYLYATDTMNSRIWISKINPDNSLSIVSILGKGDRKMSEFAGLKGMAGRKDYLYATDLNHIQILKINPDNTLSLVSTFGKKGEDLGEFIVPIGIAINEDYLYVSESVNHRIQVLKINPDGSLIAKFTFGKKGSGLGEFYRPNGLAVKGDYLYVSESDNHRIQVLKINPDGSLTAEFTLGKEGKGKEEFLQPFGPGTFKFPMGKAGRRLGEFWMPGALAVKGNFLYVSDTANQRIQVLEITYAKE